MVAVNPEVLVWARETASLDQEIAANRIGLRDSSQSTAVEKLAQIENGTKQPTRPQLYKMANAYHQPLLTLYLEKPPAKAARGHDFRSLPQRTADGEANARLDLLIRDVRAAQALVRALLEDEQAAPLPFIDSASTSAPYESLAKEIVGRLDFDLQFFRKQQTVDGAFAYLRTCLENHGIFVLLLGNLGSWQTKIDTNVFRGFALSDPIAPFIVINKEDARASWAFTAIHEVAHLWLGSSGISGALSDEALVPIEKYCNRVAGAVLLPSDELDILGRSIGQDFDSNVHQIGAFAKSRKITRAMVAYNLLLSNFISRTQWAELQQRFDKDRCAHVAAEREKQRQREGGQDPNVVKKRDLGPALLNLVKRTLNAGALTPRKAGVILGVNPMRVETLIDV